MKILIFEWATGTYTYEDVADALIKMGATFRTVSYAFKNPDEDDFFEWRFGKCLDGDDYDAVYSTNYFPLVARCCHEKHIKYISWSYDNPLNVQNIEDTLSFEENHVFLFDRIQAEKYIKKGYGNVYHMPLAANTERLDKITLCSADRTKYDSEISFVGKLYDSMLPAYMQLMDEHSKGYIQGILSSQKQVYGYYFVDELLTDEFINRINEHIKEIKPDSELSFTREVLSYAIGAQITREERLILLKLLGSHHQLKLYSREDNEIIRDAVQFMGSCGYLNEMPKIFKASKINLNINLKVSQSGVPLRVMDVLGSGGFLLSSYQPEVAEYFAGEGGVVMYDSIEDAYMKADYYLKHDDERASIAMRGHQIVKENFSYTGQLKKIFEISGIR